MEEYKASVQGVDDALARLNATLASYDSLKLKKGDSATSVQARQGEKEHIPESAQVSPTYTSPSSITFRTFQVVSKVSSEPLEFTSWRAQHYEQPNNRHTEVCSHCHIALYCP